jgi:hypothetical protein
MVSGEQRMVCREYGHLQYHQILEKADQEELK